jgi:hypothetical protein
VHCRPQFTLCGGPPALRIRQFLAFIRDWSTVLYQYCADCDVGCIDNNLKWLLEVWHFQRWRCFQCQLQRLEALLVQVGPSRTELALGCDQRM